MDKLKQKHQQILQAISSLKKSVDSIDFFKKSGQSYYPNLDFDEEYRMHRDSLIQRFEYTEDLFWKYLKKYLEDVFKLLAPSGPSPVIRESYSAGIIDEQEAKKCLEMIKDRNITSHIYVEEIAEQLSINIPGYYQLMHTIIDRLPPK